MIFLWMLVASAVGLAATAGAVALERAAHALGRPTRWPWVGALVFSSIWPAWLLVRAVASLVSASLPRVAAVLPPTLVTAGHSALTIVSDHVPVFDSRLTVVLLAGWLVATTGLLARLCLGMWFIQRERQGWRRQNAEGVPVLIAPATGPAVVGVRQPTIVLPQWLLALDPALRELVLRHEGEHVRAHDGALRLVGALLTALMPWNVGLWIQADRLALAIEVDCDSRVLAGDDRHERYGLLLLAIAQRQSTAMLAPALSEGASHLERRIAAMRRPLPKRPALVAGGCVVAASIALVIACSAPTPSSPASAAAQRTAPSSAAQQSGPNSALSPSARLADAARAGAYVDYQVNPLGGQCPRSPCREAALYKDSPPPRYPDSLERAHISGQVIAEFVINADGSVDMGTFKAVKSDNELFTDAVKAVLAQDHFYPAEVGGRPVRELVQIPYVFAFKN